MKRWWIYTCFLWRRRSTGRPNFIFYVMKVVEKLILSNSAKSGSMIPLLLSPLVYLLIASVLIDYFTPIDLACVESFAYCSLELRQFFQWWSTLVWEVPSWEAHQILLLQPILDALADILDHFYDPSMTWVYWIGISCLLVQRELD